MGANISVNQIYEVGFNQVKKWGIGLTICLGTRTPYVVYSIKPADQPNYVTQRLEEVKTAEEFPDYIFIAICSPTELPVDKDGKAIIASNPTINGDYMYEVHLKPLPKVKISGNNSKNIDAIFGEKADDKVGGGRKSHKGENQSKGEKPTKGATQHKGENAHKSGIPDARILPQPPMTYPPSATSASTSTHTSKHSIASHSASHSSPTQLTITITPPERVDFTSSGDNIADDVKLEHYINI